MTENLVILSKKSYLNRFCSFAVIIESFARACISKHIDYASSVTPFADEALHAAHHVNLLFTAALCRLLAGIYSVWVSPHSMCSSAILFMRCRFTLSEVCPEAKPCSWQQRGSAAPQIELHCAKCTHVHLSTRLVRCCLWAFSQGRHTLARVHPLKRSQASQSV